MVKPIVFISHVTEEKDVALALKGLVESAFINMMDVFVSSDPRSITLGQEWLQKIKFALSSCAVEIIIASPQSVRRPWVNFEAGAGWIRAVPVIPLCHSGMVPSMLPPPLGSFQAATATEQDELKLILPVLAGALNSSVPTIDFTEFVDSVRSFERDSRQREVMLAKNPLAETDGLLPYELETLIAIAEFTDAPDEAVSVSLLRENVKKSLRPLSVSLALKMLERKELVILSMEEAYFNNDRPYYAVRVSDPGWLWLQQNQDKLDLSPVPRPPAPERARSYDDDIPF